MKQMADLLVCGHVVTMDKGQEFRNGAVACAGNRIVAIGSEQELLEKYNVAKVIRGQKGVVLPGLVNVHTHAPMSLLRGLADDLPLMTWLQEHIFPVEAKLTSEMVHHGALLSIMEMIKSGTTSFCDMYLFAKEVARAAETMGMRGFIGEVVYDFPSPNYGELDNGFHYMDELFAEFKDSSRVTITVDPHAVYTCSPDLLVRLKGVAEEQNTAYVLHLAETSFEVAQCQEVHGASPVGHLDQLGVLDSSVVAAHCVKVTPPEIELFGARGVKVAHCPESNMKLGSGVAPVRAMLDAGVIVGLGTDGAASNNDVDLFGEMDMAAKLQKVHCLDSTCLPAGAALHMATCAGAEVLGAGRDIGTLEVGKKADIIVVEMNKPHLTPMYNAVSHLVYAARGGDVLHSIIDGRIVMEDRKLTMVDEHELLAACRQWAEKLTGRTC
ncbi:MAG: amidohydrolase [Desulfobulbaceae bacterium]|jgi:5-methylthioadenosine/S-adenosylhomocysteine deaminase|nr:amidohydrolase [Desulfobulbaceae bacterium]